jgi:murein DD-endopeptidase MepM/ murein hydrolase activator NlpD
MLIPHDHERVRSVQLSPRTIRSAISAVLLVTVSLGVFSIGFFVKGNQDLRARKLERENQLLAAEVGEMRGRMQQLDRTLETLSAKDEQFRVVSGLAAVDKEVQAAGIGGPGSDGLVSPELRELDPRVGAEITVTSAGLNTLLRRASLLNSSLDEALGALHRNRERLAATPSIAPSDGPLSSLFSRGRHHPVLRITRPHKGIDIAGAVGEPILASAKGRVIFAGAKSGGYGNAVEIDHGYGYVTRFAHISRILVRKGQTVERGEEIAEVGATGLVSGPHLHYEVEVNGKAVDPLNFILTDAIPD